MAEFDHEQLLKKFREGNCTEEELAIIESWYADWNMNDHIRLSETELRKAESLMRNQVMGRIGMRTVQFLPRISMIAASLVLITSICFYLLKLETSRKYIAKPAIAGTEILAGKEGATLTLANGQKIKLGKSVQGHLASQGAINITKSVSGEITYTVQDQSISKGKANGGNREMLLNTLNTGKGETFKVKLPDGSLVWLNADSKITFPVNMEAAKERRVNLTGEGYFEVAKDAAHPFVVSVPGTSDFSGQEIRVLGTHFNINSYPGESNAATTLLEGSISLTVEGAKFTRKLTPGQQAEVKSNNVRISEVDTENAVAWKNGYFYFDRTDITTVMNQISRWYDVNVVYEGKVPDAHITGKVHRNANLSEALQILKYLDINYSVVDRTIKIRP
ncbi:FecR family protein [Mucilaginibacter kameinonensis]|uniref:FecR family protein n=1 Tax=Mucilaginibacter kameinonensis TaxID=452286 RepID=UPI000EF83E72|nr:FecR family protein [Mucilaginibacter kameinonensis]